MSRRRLKSAKCSHLRFNNYKNEEAYKMTIDFDFDPNAVLVDSTTDIEGVNHIGLSVQNLDRVLEFYRAATGFEVIHKESFENDASADILFARNNVKVQTAILRAPN
jgi:hypothetical protein